MESWKRRKRSIPGAGGLRPTEYKNIGKDKKRKKKLWIPRGLVIPYRRDGALQRIRIRRPSKLLTNDFDQRYFVLPGSSAMPMLIGKNRRAYVVVETELDGLLIDQEASDLAGVLALGSSSNMPDEYCHPHMAQALSILKALCLDCYRVLQVPPSWAIDIPIQQRELTFLT